jgi:response regulator RpfG family c-di-GMP phosphodiesterase
MYQRFSLGKFHSTSLTLNQGCSGDGRVVFVVVLERVLEKKTAATILICDDNQDFVRALVILLRSQYSIFTAGLAAQCISTFHNALSKGSKITLVILDYQLKDSAAETVAREIKNISPETVILLVTGYELDEPGVSRMIEEKLADFRLRKPISLEALKSNISEILAKTMI